jgi:HEAT repeat protein
MSDQKLFDAALVILQGEAAARPDVAPAARFPLHWLSDLNSNQASAMARLWRDLPLPARRDLMGRMEQEARENFEMDFLAVARIALNDADPGVRLPAIRSFWECGDIKLVDKFIHFLEQDPDAAIRAGAASALGLYVERAELEEIPGSIGERITERLIALVRGKDDLEVRRRAVESLGYSSEPRVRAILENAYANPDEAMRGSALLAMGRSADPSFAKIIIAELRSSAPRLRAEAARAAGALEIKKAVSPLIELLEDVDDEVRGCAIDALGEIGGGPACEALEKIMPLAVGEEWDRIDTALENAEFQESLSDLPLLDLDETDDELGDEEDDAEDEEEQEEEEDAE